MVCWKKKKMCLFIHKQNALFIQLLCSNQDVFVHKTRRFNRPWAGSINLFRKEMWVKCSNFTAPHWQRFIESRWLDLDKGLQRFKLTAKELKAERSVDWDCSQNHQPRAQKWQNFPPTTVYMLSQAHSTASFTFNTKQNNWLISIVRVHQRLWGDAKCSTNSRMRCFFQIHLLFTRNIKSV